MLLNIVILLNLT